MKTNLLPDEFTIQDAMAIQVIDLALWETKLNPETMARVRREAGRQNKRIDSQTRPDDVWRGDNITEFILNLRNV